jgi:hypothetical protein
MGESSSDAIGNVSWTTSLEEYFAQTGEKASGLGIMHKQAESVFSRRKTYIDLPVIIGSGILAFLNAGSDNLFGEHRFTSIALGAGSFVLGVLNTLGSYFAWAKRAEGHRMSSLHYAKLYRFISVELCLPRDERMQPSSFLKYVKDQYDRLAEISPPIPRTIIRDFKARMKKYNDVSKPEETNGLHKIKIYAEAERDLAGRVEPLVPPISPPRDSLKLPFRLPTPKLTPSGPSGPPGTSRFSSKIDRRTSQKSSIVSMVITDQAPASVIIPVSPSRASETSSSAEPVKEEEKEEGGESDHSMDSAKPA